MSRPKPADPYGLLGDSWPGRSADDYRASAERFRANAARDRSMADFMFVEAVWHDSTDMRAMAGDLALTVVDDFLAAGVMDKIAELTDALEATLTRLVGSGDRDEIARVRAAYDREVIALYNLGGTLRIHEESHAPTS